LRKNPKKGVPGRETNNGTERLTRLSGAAGIGSRCGERIESEPLGDSKKDMGEVSRKKKLEGAVDLRGQRGRPVP